MEQVLGGVRVTQVGSRAPPASLHRRVWSDLGPDPCREAQLKKLTAGGRLQATLCGAGE